MAAVEPTNYFVDPSVASNGGAGTVGSPWTRSDGNCVQYALDNITRDSTNGDRINILAGTPHTGATASLSFATYGTPSNTAPFWMQGYSSAAGDGGVGTFLMSSVRQLMSSTSLTYLVFQDLLFDKTAIRAGSYIAIYDCEFRNHVVSESVYVDSYCRIVGNYFNGVGSGTVVRLNGSNTVAVNNFVECPASLGSGQGIYLTGNGSEIRSNIIISNASGTTPVRTIAGVDARVLNNSIYGAGGGLRGIWVGGFGDDSVSVVGNLIEGVTTGLYTGTDSNYWYVFDNSFYDCGTDETVGNQLKLWTDRHGNESLGSSPFVDAAGGDFTPVDVGNVLSATSAGANGQSMLNYRGAVSPAGGGGGGGNSSRALRIGNRFGFKGVRV